MAAFAAGSALLLGSQTAHAQMNLSFYSGTSHTKNSDLHLKRNSVGTDATFENIDWIGRPFSGSYYYGYRIGYDFPNTPRLGIVYDFNHYKVYAQPGQNVKVTGSWKGSPVNETAPLGDRIQEFRITNGVNTFALDVVWRIPITTGSEKYPMGRILPYIAGGPAYYIVYAINTVDGENNRHGYRKSGWGVQARGGLSYGISSHVNAFAELKYTSSHVRAETAGDGRADTQLDTWHTLAGVQYTF